MPVKPRQVTQMSEAGGFQCGVLCLRGGVGEKWTAQVPQLQLIAGMPEYRPTFASFF